MVTQAKGNKHFTMSDDVFAMFAAAMMQLDRFGATATRHSDSGMGNPNDISVSMGVFAPPVIQAVKDVQDHSILVTFGAGSDLHVIMVARERCIMAGVTRKDGWRQRWWFPASMAGQ